MSAIPARTPPAKPDRSGGDENAPFLKLHRCRLDYDAALSEHLRGGCAARVAQAAGSRATSRRNLRRVGLKIVARLESRYDVLDTFDQLGFTIQDFCRGVIAQCRAMKTKRYFYRGRLVAEFRDPDWRARTTARWLYLKATGILDLPP